jgi:hypothetical protein
MEMRWTKSAAKHSIDRADAVHAVRNAIVYVRRFDAARVEGMPAADLFIGPNRRGDQHLEVLVHVYTERREVVVFHVMLVRESTLARARQIIAERNKK